MNAEGGGKLHSTFKMRGHELWLHGMEGMGCSRTPTRIDEIGHRKGGGETKARAAL